MKIYSFFLLLFLIGCQNQSVQLPIADSTIVSGMVNHSAIYLFYEEKEGKPVAVLNDKNRIGTTNWVFHIDSRLPLKEVITHVTTLQSKKASGMHKNETDQNYFTYMNNRDKTLAFIPFSNINYAFDSYFSTLYVKENSDYHQHFEVITLRFSEKEVMINGNLVQDDDMQLYLEDYILTTAPNRRVLLYLNFNQETTFGRYLNRLVFLEKIKSDWVNIAPTHFIYDAKKLEDCGCM